MDRGKNDEIVQLVEQIKKLYAQLMHTYLYTEMYILQRIRNYSYDDAEMVMYFAKAVNEVNEAHLKSLDKYTKLVQRLNETLEAFDVGVERLMTPFDRLTHEIIDYLQGEVEKSEDKVRDLRGKK